MKLCIFVEQAEWNCMYFLRRQIETAHICWVGRMKLWSVTDYAEWNCADLPSRIEYIEYNKINYFSVSNKKHIFCFIVLKYYNRIIIPYTTKCVDQGVKGQYPKTEPWYVDENEWDGDERCKVRRSPDVCTVHYQNSLTRSDEAVRICQNHGASPVVKMSWQIIRLIWKYFAVLIRGRDGNL